MLTQTIESIKLGKLCGNELGIRTIVSIKFLVNYGNYMLSKIFIFVCSTKKSEYTEEHLVVSNKQVRQG